MLGRPAICEPVWKNVTPGPWLIDSVNIERATQMSSAMLAVCGNNSLNHPPACPCCVNLNGDPTIGIDD